MSDIENCSPRQNVLSRILRCTVDDAMVEEKSSDILVKGFPVTRSFVEKTVGEKHGAVATISDVHPLGPEAVGYMSVMRRIELEWDSADESLPKSVVIKITSSAAASDAMSGGTGKVEDEEAARHMAVVQKTFHNTEVAYLNMFSKVPSLRIPVPEIYSASGYESDMPCILMKDYGDCHLVDLIDGFNEKQLYAIVDVIVETQVFSLTNDAWKNIEVSEEYLGIMENFGGQLRAICSQLIETMPEQFGIIQRFVDNTFEKDADWMRKNYIDILEGKKLSVLVHGDLWSPQIMWKDDVTIGVVVDWQATRAGSPVEDLLRILSTSTSNENRKNLEKPLLDYYFTKLTEKLAEQDAKIPFTREQLDEEVKSAMVPGCMMTIFANAFWANSHVLKPNGVPDPKRMAISFGRCRSYIEDTLEAQGW